MKKPLFFIFLFILITNGLAQDVMVNITAPQAVNPGGIFIANVTAMQTMMEQ